MNKYLYITLITLNFALHQNFIKIILTHETIVTSIEYDLPSISMVNISVYNMIGGKVKTLVNGIQIPGFKTIQWDAKNEMNTIVSAGLYFYTIQTDGYLKKRKG